MVWYGKYEDDNNSGCCCKPKTEYITKEKVVYRDVKPLTDRLQFNTDLNRIINNLRNFELPLDINKKQQRLCDRDLGNAILFIKQVKKHLEQ